MGSIGGMLFRWWKAYNWVVYVCVLEDIEKQEWSEYVYTFPEDIIIDPFSIFSLLKWLLLVRLFCRGDSTSKHFYVFYFSFERNIARYRCLPIFNILQHVEIQSNHEAFEINNNRVYVFIDHIEDDIIVDPFSIFIVRAIAAGEIVLSGDSTSKPFYVFYSNLERDSLQSVEIQGNHEAFEINDNRVYVSIDHIEDDKINSMMKKTYMLLQHL